MGLAARHTAAYAAVMTKAGTNRLSQGDWLRAGIGMLAAKGPGALGAEPLARHLGTTKGSFYWHFKDVPAFHAALLDLWEATAMTALDDILAAHDGPARQLRALAQGIAAPPEENATLAAEPAIRSWAAGEQKARDHVTRVDAARRAHLRALLSETGIGNPEMTRIIHAAAIGMHATGTDGEEARDAIGSLLDLVLALR